MGSVVRMGTSASHQAGDISPEMMEARVKEVAGHTGMGEDMIKEHYSRWIKQHPDGKMDKHSFKEMIGAGFPGFSGEQKKKMVKNVFRIYDTNQDGYIDFEEFMVVFCVLSGGQPEEVLGKIFRMFDINGDGKISQSEMEKLVGDMKGVIQFPGNKKMTPKQITEALFEEMDKDHDGTVEEAEFVDAVLGHQKTSTAITLNIINIIG